MSRVPSAPAATPKAAQSPKKSRLKETPAERKYRKLKLFKAEYRTPFKYSALMQGRRPKGMSEPEGWLMAAIQSGLVEMGSLGKDGRVGELFEPIGDNPPAEWTGPPLEELLLAGTKDALDKLKRLK